MCIPKKVKLGIINVLDVVKKIASDELYQYKDFDYCENCIDKAIEMYGRN